MGRPPAASAVPASASYRPGSREDFDRLYQASYQRLYRTMLAILPDRDSAEDCVQDAFVRAFRSWERWKADAPAEAWLHRIAINVAISHRRRERLRQVGELVRRLGTPTTSYSIDLVTRWDLSSALKELPPKQAAVVVLRHLHGYSNREIAAALDVPERTVGSRLLTAKKKLRAHLARNHEPAIEYTADPGRPL